MFNPLDPKIEHILDAISDGVCITTSDRKIVYWNPAAERIAGYTAQDVIGMHCFDDVLAHTDLSGHKLCASACPLKGSIEDGVDRNLSGLLLKRKSGERVPVYVKTSALRDGEDTYCIEIFGELESVAGRVLATQVQELSDNSVLDPLSGLFNRRYFDSALLQHFELSKVTGRHYGVLHLDIDNFKTINDTLGHAAGDDAIRFVAGALSGATRALDVAARYGGDEFAVVCAAGSSQTLEAFGRRVAAVIRDSLFQAVDGTRHRLTVSVGAAMADPADSDERAALRRADEAMYAAKRGGRDAVVVSDRCAA